ncbi:MAG: Zinc-transporting ATPase [Chlamydiae bacterium]|nr:Zinc-transporting ATPase [Chlamydiota bacterium]
MDLAVEFEEFFASEEEYKSPLIERRGRGLSKHLSLKAACLSTAFLVLSFGFHFTHFAISNFFLLFVYFFAGIPALIASIEDLKKLKINIDVLMTLAAFFSILIDSALEGGLLLVLFAISGALEDAALSKTTSAIQTLHKLTPKTATVIENGEHVVKSIKDIDAGAIILIKPGQIIPLDGVVTKGTTSLNLSHLTGENMPQTVQEKDSVPAGSQNLEGAIEMQVTTKSSSSTLAKIIELVTKAQHTKPQVQQTLDKVGPKYAVSIILLALFFAITLPFFAVEHYLGFDGSIYRSLAFLIAASPCALIIATPTAYLSALSSCAKKGILLKGGFVLDAIHTCQHVAFDKTGTLTKSVLELNDVIIIEGTLSKEDVLKIAYSLELYSTHPIAKAICCHAKDQKLEKLEIKNMKEMPGLGIKADVLIGSNYEHVLVGHSKHILSSLDESKQTQLQDKISKILEEGQSYCILSIDSTLCLLTFIDAVRENAAETIKELHDQDLNTWMLTGDHEHTAKRIGLSLKIENIEYNLKPDEKLNLIARLNNEGGAIMLGDGINDGPALANATVGISLGSIGSDTAIEASDVVFLNDDIQLLSWLIHKAKQTKRIVFQNLFFATCVIVLTSLSALFGIVPLWLAVVLHEGGTILVAINGLRLIRTT